MEKVWIALAAGFVGWLAGGAGSAGLSPFESGLLGLQRSRTAQVHRVFENLDNQFTPGFKSRDVLGGSGLIMGQGEIFRTQTPTNLAIDGGGLFALERGRYTRDGRFLWNGGRLESRDGVALLGYPVEPRSDTPQPVSLSMDPKTRLYGARYTDFKFDEDGRLYGIAVVTDPVTGQTVSSATPLYQVALAWFANPQRLEPLDASTFQASFRSGAPMLGVAGQGTLGRIVPGSLELSNVDFTAQGLVLAHLKEGQINVSLQAGAPVSAPVPILGNGRHP